jgi:acyl carrier protein
MGVAMKDKVLSILSKVMQVDPADLSIESSSVTVATWDSLKHMNLILALEDDFDVQFTDTEIVEMLSVDQIIKTLERKCSNV